jgi:hypothetical protein
MARLVAVALTVFLLGTTTAARADDDTSRADCQLRLHHVYKALDADAKYARDWTDAWLLTGTALVTLGLTKAGQVDDYRRAEAIVSAAQSMLLMIQLPTATTTARALGGLRAAEETDPCLALSSARYILETNADDGDLHRAFVNHMIGISINVVIATIVALAVGHWDFAGHGSEGVQQLAGIAIGELQVFTYPRGSLRTSGSSLELSF